MALKQRKRFLIFYTFSFCLILGTTLIEKKKERVPSTVVFPLLLDLW